MPTGSKVWDASLLRNPHAAADKRSRVQQMFAAIAPSYDLNNRLHSLWMDQYWRRQAVRMAGVKPTDTVVDVACGTGDLSLQFAKAAGQVIGIDFTYEMLPLAKTKAQAVNPQSAIRNPQSAPDPQSKIQNPRSKIQNPKFANADAQFLPLASACCDVVSIAFGIRNVQDPAKALAEFHRILRPGGRLIILEFSLPTNPVLRALYNFYFRRILPISATLISRDRTGAYRYLPESVNTFISRQRMAEMMTSAGFKQVEARPLTFGVCVCYRGIKE